MAYKTRGVVIRRVVFDENDLILTVFTERAGKLTVFSNGARNPKNAKASGSQLFTHSDMEIFMGKNSNTLYNADVIAGYYPLREDFEKLAYGSYFLELVDFTHKEGQISRPIYAQLVEVLELLSKKGSFDYEVIKAAFEMKLLDTLGLTPNLTQCLTCEGPATHEVTFDIASGGFHCDRCASDGIILRDTVLKLLQFFSMRPMITVSKTEIHPFYTKKVNFLLDGYLRFHLGNKEFRSLKILNAFRKVGENV